jgi:hypothetical protein
VRSLNDEHLQPKAEGISIDALPVIYTMAIADRQMENAAQQSCGKQI